LINNEILNIDKTIKMQVLQTFDFAFKINWQDNRHRQIHKYLRSLAMFIRVKGFLHFGSEGNYFAVRFNDDDKNKKQEHIQKFKNLFMNESRETFTEEICNGCHIFTI
jgi:hypothetical protein